MSGSVVVSGSSTVEPIAIIVGEKFKAANPDAGVTIDGPGTGDGFELFCGGETDVSNASRPIDDEEKAACEEAGIEFTELAVGIDGLTVATNPANADVECLDIPALYALLGPESEGIDNWSGANELATEVGSAYTSLPDADLVISGPGEESGTYDTFVEFAIADLAEERGQDEVVRADYTSSPNDNIIVQGIEGSDTSLGWLGFAYYAAEQDRMKAIQIDGGEGCVAPTPETIGDGTYPFSRTLYIYVNNAKASREPRRQGLRRRVPRRRGPGRGDGGGLRGPARRRLDGLPGGLGRGGRLTTFVDCGRPGAPPAPVGRSLDPT